MAKEQQIEKISAMLAAYNRSMYEYGKEYRTYGTEHLLRHDQVHLLNYIGNNPDCNLRYLADTTGLGLPTVSLQIKKLEKMGLVVKRRADANLRELEINLSEAGQKVFDYHKQLDMDFDAAVTAQMVSQYSEAELDLIHDFVSRILMKQYRQM